MKLLPLLRTGTAALGLALGAAQAAVVYQFDANGELTGAKNVLVNNVLYDVEFKDGTCHALFDLCTNTTQFVFNTQASAHAASLALLSQVFVGAYDTDPTLLALVPALIPAFGVITPYAMGSGATSGKVLVSVAQNGDLETYDEAFESFIGTTMNTFTTPGDLFAFWSPSATLPGDPPPGGGGGSGGTGGTGGTVPEPGTLALVGASLLALRLRGRHRA